MGTGTGPYVVQYRRGQGWRWRFLTRTRQRRRAYSIATQVRSTGYHARVVTSGYGYARRPYYGYNNYAYRNYRYRRSYGRPYVSWNSFRALANAINQNSNGTRIGATNRSQTPTRTVAQTQARPNGPRTRAASLKNPAMAMATTNAAARARNARVSHPMATAAHVVKTHQTANLRARAAAVARPAVHRAPRPHTMGQHAAVHHAAVHMGGGFHGGGGSHGAGGGGGGHHGGHR